MIRYAVQRHYHLTYPPLRRYRLHEGKRCLINHNIKIHPINFMIYLHAGLYHCVCKGYGHFFF